MKKTADRGRGSRATRTNQAGAVRRRLLSLMVGGCFAAAGGAGHANPAGPQVVHGQAAFNSQGNVLSIANTPGTIINWQNFSINPGEITRFLQQNADSAVLNRIVGQDPSRILGALQSNGRVFLINPNGILFGKGAQVDVNGLVASTLNLSNEDFLAGRMRFTLGDKAGAVQNQGEIVTPAGGRVYLIAPQVENSGIIASPKGEVVLAAGHSVYLVDSVNPDLHVVVSAPDDAALNLGQIIAQGGKAGIFGALIKQRGIVSADSATVGENGRIVFRASRETVLDAGSRTSATGEGKGGEIQVLGADVSLRGDAAIDASGKAGGGTVLIGGDYQGKNPAVRNALNTTVSRDASIRADATQQGDGGKVVVWADGATRAFGAFSARGGARGGDGGLVETSGHWLDVNGIRVDAGASAAGGKAGTWLLDPDDMQIVSDADFDIALPGISKIKASGFLNATANVSLFADHDLEFKSGLRIDTPGIGLLAKAQRHLIVNGALTTNGGNIELVAKYGDDTGVATVNNAIASNNGNVSVAGGSVVVTGAGSVSSGTGRISLAAFYVDGGAVTLQEGARVSSTASAAGGLDGSVFLIADNKGGAINLDAGAKVTVGGAGQVALVADRMNLAGSSIDAGGPAGLGNVLLYSHSAGQGVELGGKSVATAGSLALSNEDLAAISAYQLTIGGSTPAPISVTAPVTLDGKVQHLGLRSATDISVLQPLRNAHVQGTVTLQTVPGGGIAFGDGGTLQAGSAIWLGVDRMDLRGADFQTGAVSQPRVKAPFVAINTATGMLPIDIVAKSEAPTTVVSTGATPTTDAPGRLELATADLQAIQANGLTIGSHQDGMASGDLTVKAALDLSGKAGALSLQAGCNTASAAAAPCAVISQNEAAPITVSRLALVSNGDVSLQAAANMVDTIAASNSGGQSNFRFRNGKALNVGTVLGVSGIQLSAYGDYWPGDATGVISLRAGGALTQESYGLLNGKAVYAEGTSVTLTANNATGVIAGKATGTGKDDSGFRYNSINPILVTDVDGRSGIGTAGKAVELKTDHAIAVSRNIDASADPLASTFDSGKAGAILLEGQSIQLASDVNRATLVRGGNVTLHAKGGLDSLGMLSAGGIAEASIPPPEVRGHSINLVADYLYFSDAPTFQADHALRHTAATEGRTMFTSMLQGANIQTPNLLIGQDGSGPGHAFNDVVVDAPIDRTGKSLFLFAARDVVQATPAPTSPDSPNGSIAAQNLAVVAGGSAYLTNPGNAVANIAGRTGVAGGGDFQFRNDGGFNIKSISTIGDAAVPTGAASVTVNGVNARGNVYLTAAQTGDIAVKAPLAATARAVTEPTVTSYLAGLISMEAGGAISSDAKEGGTITADMLFARTGKGLSIQGSSLSQLAAVNADTAAGGSNISVANTRPLKLLNIEQTGAGSITIDNIGALETAGYPNSDGVKTQNGSISLIAHSPLTINAPVSSANGGSIHLQAAASAAGNDVLQINAPVTTSGPVNLIGPAGVNGASNVVSPDIRINSNTTTPPPIPVPQLPTLDQCIANPALADCALVLPTLNQCVQTPATAGCVVVLPTLNQCVLTPNATGCSVVLPTLNQCVLTPNAAGCAVVLPTLDQCVLTPTAAGCTVVLPTLNQCVTTPAAPGCTVVLPTLNQCVLTPTATGCAVVLPTLNQCLLTPNAPGCTVVLPTLDQCVATPAAAGCAVVLPSLSQCTITPNAPGCAVVLPALSQCVTTPAAPGCSVVLPSLSQCTSSPTLPGCGVVLPPLSQCTTTPSLPGCSAVLPSVSQCTSAPATAGCSVVLPTLGQCSATPALAGCAVVLPSLGQCMTTPAAPGCAVVLPTLSQCSAAPSLAGCSAVLPSIGACTAAPGTAGCEAVLPSLALCTITPGLPGCTAVLPSLSQCMAAPTLAGCGAVLPTLNQCAESLTTPGCGAVLPTLSQCAATPTLAGCNAVVPVLNTCAMDPAAPGCEVVLPAPAAGEAPGANPVASLIKSTAETNRTTLLAVTTYGSKPASGTAGGGEGGEGGEGGASAKKADGKTMAGPNDSGAKINEASKKMYCN